MSAATSAPVAPLEPAPADGELLVGYGRDQSTRHLVRSHIVAVLAGAFAIVAFAALLLPQHRPLSLQALGVTVACYAIASLVQFEFGLGYAIPTQGILVSMWFLLPPRIIPLAVCCAMLLSGAADLVRRRTPADRLALAVASSWHAVGPAAVLYFATRSPRWLDTPLYGGAFAAQLALDCVVGFALTRSFMPMKLRDHLRSVGPAYLVDTLLAPLGLLVAFTAYGRPWALLLLLPMLGLFATFARERQRRIDNALELSSAYRGTAMLLGDVIEADDEYTGSHSRDVVDLVLDVADRLGLPPTERRRAEFAALLHDVGKVKIPAEIINKPGPLDDAEWETMKTHTILGEQMLEQIGGLLGEVGLIVRSCHERWDGNGYPDGLAGERIPLEARIVCACDAWSAMTTDRSYRKARPDAEAAEEMRRSAGTHFDPRVVETLCNVLDV